MKAVIGFLILTTFGSLLNKPLPNDCHLYVFVKYYSKGKLIYEEKRPEGMSAGVSNLAYGIYDTDTKKIIKCDSVVYSPTPY